MDKSVLEAGIMNQYLSSNELTFGVNLVTIVYF